MLSAFSCHKWKFLNCVVHQRAQLFNLDDFSMKSWNRFSFCPPSPPHSQTRERFTTSSVWNEARKSRQFQIQFPLINVYIFMWMNWLTVFTEGFPSHQVNLSFHLDGCSTAAASSGPSYLPSCALLYKPSIDFSQFWASPLMIKLATGKLFGCCPTSLVINLISLSSPLEP